MAKDGRVLPWLNSADRLVLVLVFGILAAVIAGHAAVRAGAGAATQVQSAGNVPPHLVDINTAPLWELEALRGVGQARARDIVDFREKNHGFTSVDDLAKVRGIGPKTVDELRPYLTAGGKDGDEGRR